MSIVASYVLAEANASATSRSEYCVKYFVVEFDVLCCSFEAFHRDDSLNSLRTTSTDRVRSAFRSSSDSTRSPANSSTDDERPDGEEEEEENGAVHNVDARASRDSLG